MIKLNLSNSNEHEGGSNESESDSPLDNDRSKGVFFGSSKIKKPLDQSNIDLKSEESKSDIVFNQRNEKDVNPGRIFSKNHVQASLIDEIPLSAFESSRSSDSSDTFESQYEEDIVEIEEPNQASQAQNVNLHAFVLVNSI